jgi:cytochrome P450
MSTTPNIPRIVRPIPGLRYPLPFYALRSWVKLGHPIRLFEHLHKTFGNIAQYRFMGTSIIFINHPGYIQNILVHDAHRYAKERTVRRMKVLLGEGLITSEEPIHMRQRRIAAPAFHRRRINAYADQIVAISAGYREKWQPGNTIDIAAESMALSLEIVARTLFDTKVTPDIRAINDEVNTIMGLYNFIVAFPRLENYLHLPIPKLTKFRRSKAHLDSVVDRLISERRKEIAAGEPDKGDLLSMLLTSTYEPEDSHPVPSTSPEGMSDQQVRDEVLTIFLAGYETVANALTWTWYLLSQNPEAEAKLHAELDTVLGTGDAQRLPTLADYPNLKYTEQVFAESMRLYPPAWAMGRMAIKDAALGEYDIPKGAHIFFSQYILSRTPEYFPDPLRFDPDRFTAEAKAARDRFTYIPFGAGNRQCIGESFAWMEGVFSIATIAQRWRMTYADNKPPTPQAKITLRPRDPLHMKLHSK